MTIAVVLVARRLAEGMSGPQREHHALAMVGAGGAGDGLSARELHAMFRPGAAATAQHVSGALGILAGAYSESWGCPCLWPLLPFWKVSAAGGLRGRRHLRM